MELPQLGPELGAHHAVDEKVEAGVEDNEGVVEAVHTEPDGWDWMTPCLNTHGYPRNNC